MKIVTMIKTCAILKEDENKIRLMLNSMNYGDEFKELETKLNNVCFCKSQIQNEIREWRKDENSETRKLKRAQVKTICRILNIDNGIFY